MKILVTCGLLGISACGSSSEGLPPLDASVDAVPPTEGECHAEAQGVWLISGNAPQGECFPEATAYSVTYTVTESPSGTLGLIGSDGTHHNTYVAVTANGGSCLLSSTFVDNTDDISLDFSMRFLGATGTATLVYRGYKSSGDCDQTLVLSATRN